MSTIHEHCVINIEQAQKEAQDTNKVVLGDTVSIHQVNVQSIVHIPCNCQLQKKLLPLSLFKKIVAKDQLHLN